MKKVLCLLVLICTQQILFSQNQIPLINKAGISSNGNNSYKISFELFDTDNDQVEIRLTAFVASGQNKYKPVKLNNMTGDIGFPVKVNGLKEISFDLESGLQEKDIVFHLVADDKEKLNVEEIIKNVSLSNLETNLNFLQGKRNTTDPAHLAKCRQFIIDKIQSNQLSYQELKASTTQYNCINYEVTKFGGRQPHRIYINDAHYDSFNQAPGADDNGSGVVGILEAMQILAPYESNHSIRYVFFDLEENGLIGSILYLLNQTNKNDSIKAVFNYEMIGYYSEADNSQQFPSGFNLLFPDAYNKVLANNNRGDFITNVANTNSSALKSLFDKNAASYVPGLKVISLEAPSNGNITPDLRRSDHAPFWDKNIPALMITDGANFRNKNYHTAKDSVPYLNFNFMANVVKTTIASLIELAEVQHAAGVDIPLQIVSKTNAENKDWIDVHYLNKKIILDFNDVCEKFNLSIINQQGNVITQSDVLNGNRANYVFNAKNLNPGIYYIQVNCSQKKYSRKIFIH